MYNAQTELGMTLKTLMAHGSQKEQLIKKFYDTRDLPVSVDGKICQKHELMRSETLDGAAILLPDLVRAINEGAQPAVANLSELYEVINTSSNQVKVPKGNQNSFGSYAPVTPEAASGTVDNNRLLYSMIDIIKPRSIVEITREMIEDSEVDMIAREVSAAGARVGNTMQSIALYELLNNAAEASTETVTSAKTLKEAINMEIANIQKNGYVPDRIMLNPKAGAWLRDELTPGYYAGNDPMHTGAVPELYGIKCFVNPIAPATKSGSDYTPGAGTFGGNSLGIGAVIYAKPKAVTVAIRDPVGTDAPFKDIYRDLTALSASCRFGAAAIHTLDTTNHDLNAAVYISA